MTTLVYLEAALNADGAEQEHVSGALLASVIANNIDV